MDTKQGCARLKVNDTMNNFIVNTSKRDQVSFKDLVTKKTVFWVIRYIGCPVCRYDVHLLAQNYQRIADKGYQLFVIMQSDQEHIKADLKGVDIPFEIICDSSMEIYKTLDIQPAKTEEELVGDVDCLKAKGSKAKEFGFVHGDYEGDELQLPALFMVDEQLKITYAHYGKHITDMPSVDELIELL